MKQLYSLLMASLLTTTIASAQVVNGGFFEKFEGMSAGAPPSGGWLAAGGFSVLGTPHGKLNGTEVNGLSKELFTNSGTSNCDSVLSPKLTNMNLGLCNLSFDYRICDWMGGMPSSATVLNPGDTCYFTLMKWKGSIVTQRTNVYKIHKGNHSQAGTGFVPVYSVGSFWPFNCTTSDTIQLCIKVKRGTAGDYWYDLDNILFSASVGVKTVGDLQADVFPNPAANIISIRLSHDEKLSGVTVRNTAGETVFAQQEFGNGPFITVGLEGLPPGLYLAEISLENGFKTTRKIVKK